MSNSTYRIQRGDVDILRYLNREGADYVAIIAARTGKYPPYVDRRCHRLVDYGLIENVDNGVVFRISESGREKLEKYAERANG